jgi:hypothetical protein
MNPILLRNDIFNTVYVESALNLILWQRESSSIGNLVSIALIYVSCDLQMLDLTLIRGAAAKLDNQIR